MAQIKVWETETEYLLDGGEWVCQHVQTEWETVVSRQYMSFNGYNQDEENTEFCANCEEEIE